MNALHWHLVTPYKKQTLQITQYALLMKYVHNTSKWVELVIGIGLVTIVFMNSIVDNRVVLMTQMKRDHIRMIPHSSALKIQVIKHLYKLYHPGISLLQFLNTSNLYISTSLHMIHTWHNRSNHTCNQSSISNLLTNTNHLLQWML